MNPDPLWLGRILSSLAVAVFLVGLACMLTQRNAIKQVIGLKIMLQGVMLALVEAGRARGELEFVQTIVVSALIAEAVVIAIATALIVNVFRVFPSGDVDRQDRLRG